MTRRHGDVIGDSTKVQSQFYDGLNRPTYWENTRGGDAWFSRMHYQFDNVGREVATWRDEDGNKGERFTFNASNHLTKAVYKADNVSTQNPVNALVEQVYTYPADMLNRASMTENGVVTNYAPNGLNQYTNVGGTSVQYDGNFNLSAFGTATATYNAKNQLTSVSNGSSAQFVYDGLGRCMKRTVNGVPVLFAYDGWKPVVEYDGAGNLQARNIYGAGPDEILVRGSGYGWFFYHTDKQGNVTALVDLNGNVVEKYTYDAFGKPTITDWWGTPHYDAQGRNASWYGNRFMYTGREWVAELNLYDYRNRFYFPLIGRFLQTDPLGLQTEGEKLTAEQAAFFSLAAQTPEAFTSSEMNLFRYCADDPVDGNDPLGLEFKGAGEATLVHDLKDADGLALGGLTGPYDVTSATAVVPAADGTFSIIVQRFDVTVVDKQVAQTINGRTRSPAEIRASRTHENLHESKARRDHDANQHKVLRTGLTRSKAEGLKEKERKALVNRFQHNREQEQRDCKKGVGEWNVIRREEYRK